MKLDSIDAIARALNDANVPFLVVGGLAVVAHGYGRHTQDLDLVIRLEPSIVHRAFQALSSLGYCPRVPVSADGFADAQQRARWINEKGMTVLAFHSEQHRETPVDVFVTEPFDFDVEYASAIHENLTPDVPVRIVRLENIVSHETAGRPASGSGGCRGVAAAASGDSRCLTSGISARPRRRRAMEPTGPRRHSTATAGVSIRSSAPCPFVKSCGVSSRWALSLSISRGGGMREKGATSNGKPGT